MNFLSCVVICAAAMVMIYPQQSEAKLGLMVAPFVWATNLAKDAAQTLVAYKLSLATKALAMITGNRSFRATIAYDSQLERFEEEHADDNHDADWSGLKSVAAITAAPNPVHIENEVKVDWLPGVTKPVTQLPTLPPKPNVHVPEDVSPVIHLPSLPPLPKLIVPKVVVPKIVVPPFVVPDLVKTKAALLDKLGHKSGQLLAGGQKYASGFVKGGFRVGHGHGVDASHSIDIKLGSGPQQGFAPATPAVSLGASLVEHNNVTGQNTSSDVPVHRPVRSIDATTMGRYFKFIQTNDEGRCVALMVCSMAADPLEFGAYGRKVVKFFESVQPSASSPVATYKDASRVGRSGGSCKSRYPSCRVNPKYLAELGESRGF